MIAPTVGLLIWISVISDEHNTGELFTRFIFAEGITATSAVIVVGFTQPFPLTSNS